MSKENPTVRATDDEALASRLWGDGKEWDADRGQWVPKAEEPVKESSKPVAKKVTPAKAV